MTRAIIPAWAKDVPQNIQAIVVYSLKRPGLEIRNYVSSYRDKEGYAAYRAECRQIAKDLQTVRDAVRAALDVGVTDADIEEASKRAFSGRLTVKNGQIDYCTGQYWPVEYRKACAAVLNYAASQKC